MKIRIQRPRNTILAIFSVVICFVTACDRTPVGEVVAKVGDVVLTMEELERRVPIHLNGRVTALDRQRMVEAWVEEQLLYQEAVSQNVDDDPTIKRRIDESTQSILTSELLQRSFSSLSVVTEADLQAYYAEHSDRFLRSFPELRARQILVKGRSDASRVKKRLGGGAMFDQVAREESLDASRDQGGDVGYFTEELVDPAFWTGCNKAKIGKLTQIYTPLGYHLVEVLDRREAGTVKKLLDVRDEIRQEILTERRTAMRKQMIEEIRNRVPATIEYNKLPASE